MIRPNRQNTALKLILFLCLFLPIAVTGNNVFANTSGSDVEEHSINSNLQISREFIRQYLSNEQEYKHHLELVQQFYKERNYKLAWFKNSELIPQADKLIEAIGHADKEGLSHQKYKVKELREMYRAYAALPASDKGKQQKQEELDVALTASYFNYASDFYKGAVDPHSAAGIEWEVKRNKIKLNKALEAILEEKENSPYYEFDALHEGYVQLRDALVKYRSIQENGGWEKVEGPEVVKLNDTAEVVLALRKRLLPQQQMNRQDTTFMVYDEEVKEAVTHFQKRHGLLVDGILGPQTYSALNVPVEKRIEQLVLNMERWRWLPRDLAQKGDKYILVNIPAYQVHVMENGKEIMQMKAVVGKTMHSTPVFSHKVQYLMFSPYWNIPNSIVANEIKPKMQQNRNWLESQNMEMVTTFGPNARRVPVNRVNWYTLTQDNFRYRIRQRPGPNNSLGKVKFMFPNEYSVYLHDTPADHLFSEADRDFSHGCVRLEKPADLATYLLRNKPGWDRQRVVQAMNASREQRVDLPEEVPVYLVYFTAWVDEAGKVQFREDLYDHDKALAQRLF
ncbi:L,D-transpeptidase family protein [Pontibacter cellulosilyticus]|uniref:L,D-transpeptidase family protein n=1 Tax=Pontibacter cellulosilyticus TaxID=1720253 RepID=A0A923SIR8_9BACT|nr:L,D-transpeptidase family protein [Pontibacter cellulosilyticus]MBC5991961.1 L,D-transpeptidase family protein [Pontibacter cellulosilyticus]